MAVGRRTHERRRAGAPAVDRGRPRGRRRSRPGSPPGSSTSDLAGGVDPRRHRAVRHARPARRRALARHGRAGVAAARAWASALWAGGLTAVAATFEDGVARVDARTSPTAPSWPGLLLVGAARS